MCSLSAEFLVNPFYEEPDGVAAELLEKHLLSMTVAGRVDHRRFLGRMVYEKKVGRCVARRTSKPRLLYISLVVDQANYDLVTKPAPQCDSPVDTTSCE